MNTKPNSIGNLSAMNSALRVQGFGEPVARDVHVRVVRTRHADPPARAHIWIGPRSADESAGEFWETLSYAVIWLCGLAAICLCVR